MRVRRRIRGWKAVVQGGGWQLRERVEQLGELLLSRLLAASASIDAHDGSLEGEKRDESA
jgi:hypothetical protein